MRATYVLKHRTQTSTKAVDLLRADLSEELSSIQQQKLTMDLGVIIKVLKFLNI